MSERGIKVVCFSSFEIKLSKSSEMPFPEVKVILARLVSSERFFNCKTDASDSSLKVIGSLVSKPVIFSNSVAVPVIEPVIAPILAAAAKVLTFAKSVVTSLSISTANLLASVLFSLIAVVRSSATERLPSSSSLSNLQYHLLFRWLRLQSYL